MIRDDTRVDYLTREQLDEFYQKYWGFWFHWYLRGPLLAGVIAVGLAGNFLTLLVVWGRCVRARLMNIYLLALVVCNTGYLAGVAVPEVVAVLGGEGYDPRAGGETECRGWAYGLYTTQYMSAWVLVLLITDFFMIFLRINKRVDPYSKGHGSIAICCCVLFVVTVGSIALLRWVNFYPHMKTLNLRSACVMDQCWWYRRRDNTDRSWVFSITQNMVPSWLIIIALAYLIRQLRRFRKSQKAEKQDVEGGVGRAHMMTSPTGSMDANVGSRDGYGSMRIKKRSMRDRKVSERSMIREEKAGIDGPGVELQDEPEVQDRPGADGQGGQEAQVCSETQGRRKGQGKQGTEGNYGSGPKGQGGPGRQGIDRQGRVGAERKGGQGCREGKSGQSGHGAAVESLGTELPAVEPVPDFTYEEMKKSQVWMVITHAALYLVMITILKHCEIVINYNGRQYADTPSFLRGEIYRALGYSVQLFLHSLLYSSHLPVYCLASRHFRARLCGMFCRGRIQTEEKLRPQAPPEEEREMTTVTQQLSIRSD